MCTELTRDSIIIVIKSLFGTKTHKNTGFVLITMLWEIRRKWKQWDYKHGNMEKCETGADEQTNERTNQLIKIEKRILCLVANKQKLRLSPSISLVTNDFYFQFAIYEYWINVCDTRTRRRRREKEEQKIIRAAANRMLQRFAKINLLPIALDIININILISFSHIRLLPILHHRPVPNHSPSLSLTFICAANNNIFIYWNWLDSILVYWYRSWCW